MQTENTVIVDEAVTFYKPRWQKFLEAVSKQKFKPNFMQASKLINMPVTTLYDQWTKIVDLCDVEVTITIKRRDK